MNNTMNHRDTESHLVLLSLRLCVSVVKGFL